MVFLCVLAFLTYFDRVCIVSAQNDIKRDLRLSDGEMGLVFSAFWLSYALLEIPGGWMGDRFGPRRTLTRIVLAWSVFTALSGSAVGFLSLFLYRFLFGAGEAGAYPNMAKVQYRWVSARTQARAGGILWLISRWGGALSYVIFPTMLAAIDSPKVRHLLASTPGLHFAAGAPAWRIGFWTCGIAGLVWVALFYPWFRDDPAQKASVNAAELDLIRRDQPPPESRVHRRLDAEYWLALITNRSILAISIAYLCTSFSWSFFVSWMPRYLSGVQHLSVADSKWINTGPLLFGGAACLVGGWLSDLMVRRTGRRRLGRVIFPMCGAASAAVAMYCMQFARTPAQAATLMCVASFASDFGQAAAWASIIAIGGEYAGTAFGFMNMVANLGGNVLQPPVGQWVFNHYGWPPLFLLYGGMYLFAACMWLLIDPTRTFYDRLQSYRASRP